jgi:hypothetical protein
MTAKFESRLRNLGKIAFGRNSFIYQFGAKCYRVPKRVNELFTRTEPSSAENALRVADLARTSQQCQLGSDAKRIVFLNVRGWPLHLATDAILASHLRQMGHHVSFLWCSDSVPFCMLGSTNHPPESQRNCLACCETKNSVPGSAFERTDLPSAEEVVPRIHEYIESLTIEGCLSYEWDGVPYGELMYRSIVWYLRRSKLVESDTWVYRKALLSAHAVRVGLEQMVVQRRPDTVVMLNGDFSVERVAGFVLKRLGVRYVSHDYTFHQKLAIGVNCSVWDHLTFETETRSHPPVVSHRERKQALKLLGQWRITGGYQGHLYTTEKNGTSYSDYRKFLGLDSRPVATAYTNLTFESSVLGKDRTFANQFEWLAELIGWFRKHSDFQLIIRSHPAELRNDHWRPNESLTEFIRASLSPLPENVHLIGPDSAMSSYQLGILARVVLVYSSTLGLEFAERCKHVITAAHVHYAGRGFTIDPESNGDYFKELKIAMTNDSLLSQVARQKLIDYVAWFMFRRLTKFEAISNVQDQWPKVICRSLKHLGTSKFSGVQQVCRLIADGKIWW